MANWTAPAPGGANPYARKRLPANKMAMQGKTSDQDVPDLATKYSCSMHAISYYQPKGEKAQCPLCDAEAQIRELRGALSAEANKSERLYEENRKLRLQTDVVESIRDAIEITGQDDLMWLKTVLYQWKIDRSIGLKVTHGVTLGKGRKKGGRPPAPNGFISMPRSGDPEGYACTSMGGLAIAEYFEEALNTVGSAQAMILLVRAFAKELPGATG